MPLASYVLSLCLHVLIILIIWFWPAGKPLINLEQPVMISLVAGAPGGNKTPSPILGPMGAKAEGEPAPAPAAQQADVAASEREATKASEIKAPKDEKPMLKEEPKKPELKPEPRKEPEPKEKPVSPKKREEVRKPEPKKEEEKPKPEPKKPQEEKKDKKQTTAGRDQKSSERKAKEDKDAIAGALNQARRKATSRGSSGSSQGSSVEQALAEARRNAGGNRGGGGGEGSGPGGGGLHSVYIGQVMLAVRPNWGYASASRRNLQCTVHITVSKQGEVKTTQVVQSSGNAQYDASCINAIMRTSKAGDFPPPPTPMYEELDIVFTLSDLRG